MGNTVDVRKEELKAFQKKLSAIHVKVKDSVFSTKKAINLIHEKDGMKTPAIKSFMAFFEVVDQDVFNASLVYSSRISKGLEKARADIHKKDKM
ncbi:MAG: hypothetical protein ACRC6X_00090 [Culicoidibacterales bacterium]